MSGLNNMPAIYAQFVPPIVLLLVGAVIGALVSAFVPAAGERTRRRVVRLLFLSVPLLTLLYLSPPVFEHVWQRVVETRTPPKMDVALSGCVHYDGGSYQWSKSFVAKPGDRVDLLVEAENRGMGLADNMVTRIGQPTYLSPEPWTAYFGNANHPDGLPATGWGDGTALFAQGLNLGDYYSGANSWVIIVADVPRTKPAAADGLSVRPDGLVTYHPVAFARCDHASEVSGTCEIQVKY